MATLLDLFTILDGYDQSNPPPRIDIDPDPALARARRAIHQGTDVDGALEALDEQIRVVRPAMRALAFNLIETMRSEHGWSRDKTVRLASDLHRHSALLLLKVDRVDAARHHLLSAIACWPVDPNLPFFLVDAYAQENRFADGFALLDRTYDHFAAADPGRWLALYRLTLDAERGGRFEDARGLYESLVSRPPAGIVADLCRRRLHLIERGEHSVPSPEILNGWYQQALEKHQAGQADEAIALLCDVLASMPSHTTSWFFLGYLYARPEAGFDTAGGVMTIPRSINEARRERLDRAVQTLEIAARSVEGPDLRLESHRLLAACYLELGDTGKAVESATAVTELDKDSSESWANLSMAHLGNRAVEEAVQAAVTALQLDQRNEVARHVLATLQIRFGDPK